MDKRIGNKFALGNKGGRPPKYSSPEEYEKKINEYFESLLDDEGEFIEFPAITGLALYLGFGDKTSLYDYRKKKEFSHSTSRAIMSIERHYENRLNFNGSNGAVFALKNMSWKDKSEHDFTTKGEKINEIDCKKLSTKILKQIQEEIENNEDKP